jgi:hypothetical protein
MNVSEAQNSRPAREAKDLQERVEQLECLLEWGRQKDTSQHFREPCSLSRNGHNDGGSLERRLSSSTRDSAVAAMLPPLPESTLAWEVGCNRGLLNETSVAKTTAKSEVDRDSPLSSNSSSKGLVDRLLDPCGQVSIDHRTGRLRYFGPLTNLHTFWDVSLSTDVTQKRENNEITASILRNLSVETHDYLMSCFWTYHNTIFHVIHKEAFYKDKESENGKNYSGLLHICILALGYRFADKSRPSIRDLVIPDSPRESILHREAKRLFEQELKHPGGTHSIQALLLLADLECGCGRDNTGWMYAGKDCRSFLQASG